MMEEIYPLNHSPKGKQSSDAGLCAEPFHLKVITDKVLCNINNVLKVTVIVHHVVSFQELPKCFLEGTNPVIIKQRGGNQI